MTLGGSDDGKQRSEHVSRVASDDWQRYGLSRRGRAADQGPRDALGRPIERVDRRAEAADELFIHYRREASQRPARPAGARRSPRFVANAATVSIVGALGIALLVFGLATAPVMPVVSPSPSRLASHTPNASDLAVVTPLAPKAAHVSLLIDLPVPVSVNERDWPLDDGTYIYLTGSGGGLAVEPSRGTIQTVYGGPAFAGGAGRAVVDDGLWVSSWPASAKSCGPSCWAGATTFQVNPVTGAVSKTLAATYLLGAADDGIWVATGKVIQRLDPSTAAVVASTPWTGSAEPRIGCGSLWSFTPGAQASTLAQIDLKTGAVLGTSPLDPAVGFGPTFVQGQCWMMSGAAGASVGATTLVWLNADGTTQATFEYAGKSIVSLDREFWLYSSDAQIRRIDATSGTTFGAAYALPVRPPNEDPRWLFSASSSLWLIEGNQLVKFDVLTGAASAAG
ncbi:MAG: hypothetical protein ABSC46_10160 [Candidatus Limnocylindrales bacterium]|jgi:hypothetical protein